MYHVSNGDRTVSGLTLDKAGSGFLKRDDAEGIFLYSPGHRMEPDVNSHYGPDAVHHEIDVSDLEIAVIGVKGVEDPRLKEMEVLRLDNPDATDADLAKLVRIDGVHDVAEGITTLFKDVEPGRVKAVNPERVPGSTLPPQMPMRGESNAVHDVTAVTASRDGVRTGIETDAGQTLYMQDPGPLGPKGWAEVDAASGFTFIGALEGADISTFAHEMSHSMHGQLIARGDPKMMQRLADAFGVEDYRHWDADA